MFKDLIGQKFGKLTVVSRAESTKQGKSRWNCVCECGGDITTRAELLRLKKTQSCGCIAREMTIKRSTTHGMGHSKLNLVWQELKSRCNNPKHKRYFDYGGRGISYEKSWEHFINFYNDMHPTYSEGLQLDRINNDGDYSLNNCKWSTPLEQNNNKRNNVFETICGITATRSQLADMYGIPRCTFYWRINHGLTVEQALGIGYKKRTKLNKNKT